MGITVFILIVAGFIYSLFIKGKPVQTYEIWLRSIVYCDQTIPAHLFGTQVARSFRLACIKQFGYEDVDFDHDSLTYCGAKLHSSKEKHE